MSQRGWWSGLGLELAWLGGCAPLAARLCGGAGVILRFERVRPARPGDFQPFKARAITPQKLDRLIGRLQRWKFDIVGIDEACRRAGQPRTGRRFVCLTFDGAHRDMIDYAYPVLARHRVPFTLYLPTAFADGLGEAWWLGLEAVIERHDRIRLMIDHRERDFACSDAAEKIQTHHYLDSWLRTLPPPALSVAINDLCARYSVDLAGLTRAAVMTWDALAPLIANPRVTIGTSTVHCPILANLTDAEALREITMGRAVAEAALGRDSLHLAFPFGDRASFDARHRRMAAGAGFASAVTSIAGVVQANGKSDLYALPRIDWDSRRSLRAWRVKLSGLMAGG
ncbi:MAG: polysaccharide deacetylase [Tardiphaga sp.]